MVTKCPLLMQLRGADSDIESVFIGTNAADMNGIPRDQVPTAIEDITRVLLENASEEEKRFDIAKTPIVLKVCIFCVHCERSLDKR